MIAYIVCNVDKGYCGFGEGCWYSSMETDTACLERNPILTGTGRRTYWAQAPGPVGALERAMAGKERPGVGVVDVTGGIDLYIVYMTGGGWRCTPYLKAVTPSNAKGLWVRSHDGAHVYSSAAEALHRRVHPNHSYPMLIPQSAPAYGDYDPRAI